MTDNWRKTWRIYPGHYNSDQVTDLFLYDVESCTGTGYLVLLDSEGQGRFASMGDVNGSWRETWQILPGDYDGDGVTDLFLYDPSGSEAPRGQARLLVFDG